MRTYTRVSLRVSIEPCCMVPKYTRRVLAHVRVYLGTIQ